MQVLKSYINNQFIFNLDGEMIKENLVTLKNSFEASDSDIILNFENVTKFDSYGITFLINLFEKQQNKDSKVILTEVPDNVMIYLELTQVAQFFIILNEKQESLV